jgi:hypothetical protein
MCLQSTHTTITTMLISAIHTIISTTPNILRNTKKKYSSVSDILTYLSKFLSKTKKHFPIRGTSSLIKQRRKDLVIKIIEKGIGYGNFFQEKSFFSCIIESICSKIQRI